MVADYISLPEEYAHGSAHDALTVGHEIRDRIEVRNSSDAARQIFPRLTTSSAQIAEQIRIGSALAQSMSWEVVVESYFLPGLKKACA